MAHNEEEIAFQMISVFQVKGNKGELYELTCQEWWFPRVVTF